MATDRQGLAQQQVETISSHIRDALSFGVNFLKTELGIELDFKPERYPPWLILSSTLLGLLVLVATMLLVARRGFSVGRKRKAVANENTDAVKASTAKMIKTDETKRKSKKKPAEKKVQSNGRTILERVSDVKHVGQVAQPTTKQQEDNRFDKLMKKNKKKGKMEVKTTPSLLPTVDRNESEEDVKTLMSLGDWQTQVSNKERRQQRRKEKDPLDGSPKGRDRGRHQGETPSSAASRRSKAAGSWTEVSRVNRGNWAEPPLQMAANDGEKWRVETRTGHRSPKTMKWTQEYDGGGEPGPGRSPPTSETAGGGDLQWNSLAGGDEWSDFNGYAAVDPSSDWNAPTELWGNYEGVPPPVSSPLISTTATATATQQSLDSDDDKEKGNGGLERTAKSRRKKKKKKKEETEEEGYSSSNPPAALEHVGSSKHYPHNAGPQRQNDQNVDPPKQTNKKKARRET